MLRNFKRKITPQRSLSTTILILICIVSSFLMIFEVSSTSENEQTSPITLIDETIQSASLDQNSSQTITNMYNQSAPVFEDTILHEVHLDFEDSDWYNTLYNAHAYDDDDPYFPVEIQYDNISVGEVGINFKGSSSFRDGGSGSKKSFRIDFNEYTEELTLLGLEKLNLNNGFMDPSFLREKLFWDTASNYIDTVRCAYAKVFVNGEYYGLFTVVEHIDQVFVQSRFGSNEDGNLYRAESQCSLNYLGDDQDEYTSHYELKTNENMNDYSDLIDFLAAFNNKDDLSQMDYKDVIEEVLDVESTLYSLALLNIFSSLDSYIGSAHNFYLYDREDTGQFTHLLWDSNMAFGTFSMGLEAGDSAETLDPLWVTDSEILLPEDQDGGGRPGQGPGDNQQSTSSEYEYIRPLQSILFEIPEYNALYLNFMAEILRNDFNLEAMDTKITAIVDLIEEAYETDPNGLYTYQEFEKNINEDISSQMTIYGIRSFITERSEYLTSILNEYANPSDLHLNELMVENADLIFDEDGEAEPWLEIYNAGSGLIETNSLYLTDDPTIPNKWQIPNFSLEDGDYLVIWLDGESYEGENHTNFLINIENIDSIYLYYEEYENSEEFSLIDSLSIPALSENCSYGKIWEKSYEYEWSEMNQPTPGESNCESVKDIIYSDAIVFTEIMANNKDFIENPAYDDEFSDWIEMYNEGNNSVDLSGMYLTDDLIDPTMWCFPEGCSIQSTEYLVIWADGTMRTSNWEWQSEIANGDYDSEYSISYHTNFRLSATGESIYLISADQTIILANLTFPATITDFSYGCYLNESSGISSYSHLSYPTPGDTNILIQTELSEEEETSLMAFSSVTAIGLISLVIIGYRMRYRVRAKQNGFQ